MNTHGPWVGHTLTGQVRGATAIDAHERNERVRRSLVLSGEMEGITNLRTALLSVLASRSSAAPPTRTILRVMSWQSVLAVRRSSDGGLGSEAILRCVSLAVGRSHQNLCKELQAPD